MLYVEKKSEITALAKQSRLMFQAAISTRCCVPLNSENGHLKEPSPTAAFYPQSWCPAGQRFLSTTSFYSFPPALVVLQFRVLSRNVLLLLPTSNSCSVVTGVKTRRFSTLSHEQLLSCSSGNENATSFYSFPRATVVLRFRVWNRKVFHKPQLSCSSRCENVTSFYFFPQATVAL